MNLKSPLLQKLEDEGYHYITTIASGLQLYKSDEHKVFYDPRTDRITTPISMTKRPWEVYDTAQAEKKRRRE